MRAAEVGQCLKVSPGTLCHESLSHFFVSYWDYSIPIALSWAPKMSHNTLILPVFSHGRTKYRVSPCRALGLLAGKVELGEKCDPDNLCEQTFQSIELEVREVPIAVVVRPSHPSPNATCSQHS